MAIEHRIKPKFKTRNEQIVARIRAEAGADAPIDPRMRIKKLVAEIAYLMALVHGGDFRVEIDHEDCFVVVRRRSQSTLT